VPDIDLGRTLGPLHHPGLGTEQIAAYLQAAQFTGSLFYDLTFARSLGYRGIIVPGPLLAALVEQFLRRELPGWEMEHLSTTFRVPTVTGDPFLIRGAVTERHETPLGSRIVCDVVISHRDTDNALTATVTLHRAR
jgi:hypothetical protein